MRVGSFFVLRSPLLEALHPHDPKGALSTPAIREALAWASPSLLASAQEGSTREGILLAVSRYLQRMSGRATPFSILAGYSLGRVYGPTTSLKLRARSEYRRIIRLSLGTAHRLIADDGHEHPDKCTWTTRADILWFPDVLRVATRSTDRKQTTTFDVDRSPALDAVLKAASESASFPELVEAVLPFAQERDEAEAFVRAVLENKLLVPTAAPPVFVTNELESLRSTNATSALADRLSALRDTPLAEPFDVAAVTDSLGLQAHDLISDLVKPSTEMVLGRDVVKSVLDVIPVLQRVFMPFGNLRHQRMQEFAKIFARRYGSREVRLVEALDARRGLSFPRLSEDGSHSELDSLARLDPWLVDIFTKAVRSEEDVVLTEASIPNEKLWDTPETFALVFSLKRDPISLWCPTLIPQPGTALFARGAGVLPSTFTQMVREFLTVSGLDEVTDVCDLAYYRPGRATVISQYPPLQPFEISLSPRRSKKTSVDINDVLVSVDDWGRFQLKSSLTGRRLRVRPTNAMNPDHVAASDLFCFLHAVSHDKLTYPSWSWGPLRTAAHLPRVRYKEHVLSPAEWRLTESQSRALRAAKTQSQRWDAAHALRRSLALPRFVRFEEGNDQGLVVDLESRWSVAAWLDVATDRMRLVEAFPAEQSMLEGPEGKFHHEIALPMTSSPNAPEAISTSFGHPTFDDVLPGGNVLYARIFGDVDHLPLVLEELVEKIVRPLSAMGALKKWFYLFFSEGERELRLRLFGDPTILWSHSTLSEIRAMVEPRVNSRILHELRFDTYQRETYRYGGPRGMELAEDIFCQSSELALALRRRFDFMGEEASEYGSYLVPHVALLRGILSATGLTLEEQRNIARSTAERYVQSRDPVVSRQLATELYRSHASSFGDAAVEALSPSQVRSLRTTFETVRATHSGLETPLDVWIGDCLHVHSLRILTTWHPLPHLELVSYHLLAKLITSEIHRQRG